MPRFYSDHYTADGINQTQPQDVFVKNSRAVDGGLIRYKRCRLDSSGVTIASGVLLRFMALPSDIRPIALYLSTPGGMAPAMNFDIGLYEPGSDGHELDRELNGLFIDQNMFSNNFTMHTARNRPEILTSSSGNIPWTDRGLQLWELVNLAAPGKYAVDPQQKFHLIARVQGGGVGDDLIMEIYYT